MCVPVNVYTVCLSTCVCVHKGKINECIVNVHVTKSKGLCACVLCVCVCVCIFCVHNIYKQNRNSKGCSEFCVHLCMCVYIIQSKGDREGCVCVCVCMCGEGE